MNQAHFHSVVWINQGYTERSFKKEEEVEIENWIQQRLSPIKAQTRR